tara:strand:+ start:3406 stop:5079 length:1674 start_codon:yes stop_codon:yes gene_type:complete
MSFFIIFLFCFITSIFFINFGIISNKIVFNITNKSEILENCLLGIISLSIIALISNFFTSLNIYFNSIFILVSFLYLIKLDKKDIIKIFNYSLLIALISLLTISLDNTNRPDSGLYHLPFTSLLNDSTLVVGVSNLNERFGIISILQYLSAINFNLIFNENGILIPLVIIYSTILLFFFEEIFKKKNQDHIKILSFLFFSFILINMNRYSGFGNDAPAQMFYFLIMFYFLKENNKNNLLRNYKIISILSLYAFLIKPFFIITFILPILFILNNFKKINIFNKTILFLTIVFFIWLVKNIFISGCLIYPIELTCFQSLDWSLKNSLNFSLESKAWAKGWPDRVDKSLNYENYLINFKWITVWFGNHFKIILGKISPFIFILIILSIILFFSNEKKLINRKKEFYQLIAFNFVFLIIWFFSFPAYRFGSGIIGSFCTLIFIYIFFQKINFQKKIIYKSVIFFIIFLSASIILKNINRISEKYKFVYFDYPWPKKNSFSAQNEKNQNIIVKKDAQFLYFLSPLGKLCYYSQSPCTHIRNLKIKKTKFLNFYEKYTIDNKD